jgi:hypothetical protein
LGGEERQGEAAARGWGEAVARRGGRKGEGGGGEGERRGEAVEVAAT